MEPMSYSQIAQELDISVNEVKRIERSALFKLKQNPKLLQILLDMPSPPESLEDKLIHHW